LSYIDPSTPGAAARFYRVQVSPRTPESDWKNEIEFPHDPFTFSSWSPWEELNWVKFAILLDEPHRVIYQDSMKHLFHYDFATQRIERFRGMSRTEFDAISLRAANQQVILGAVLLPSNSAQREFGIQFVGLDPYPRELARDLINLVASTVKSDEPYQAFYLPVFEQRKAAETDQNWFASQGINVSSVERWIQGSVCYSSGWALGRLKFIPEGEIEAAYLDGRLTPFDILVTPRIPAEIPFVAGIIALRAATPNSHVAILARSNQTPFVYLADEVEKEKLLSLEGRQIVFRAFGSFMGCDIQAFDMENMAAELKAEILELKQPPPLNFPAKESYGSLSAPVKDLTPGDSKFFGGKAANFGLLSRTIPNHSPEAIALSFDLWDAFMEQRLINGKTLREEIAERLAAHSWPADIAQLRQDLASVRSLIRQTARFSPEQQQEIIALLQGFDPERRIRFRSSSNVEDGEHFTGAGLYDSYSGCLADDLDPAPSGPSHCNPETGKRGVFRAIQRVYASFYNENAFLERLRHGVDESLAGMAILVHHSYPDEIEMANGVATMTWNGSSLNGQMVTQAGPVSVTNPDSAARPETVQISRYDFGTFMDMMERSSLVQLGATVMEWETDYQEFAELFFKLAQEYQKLFPGKERFVLDLEYKKVVPGNLEIKQIREIPQPDTTPSILPFILNRPLEYAVYQGEWSDAFAVHRLKSFWQFNTINARLDEENLDFYADTSLVHIEEGAIKNLNGPPSSWPGASFAIEGDELLHAWTSMGAGGERVYRLSTIPHLTGMQPGLPPLVARGENPLLTLTDFDLNFSVRYPSPVATIEWGEPKTTSAEMARLEPRRQRQAEDLLQERTFTLPGGGLVRTSFYWPPPPRGITAGYTAPLVAWVETSIEGLVSETIVLKSEFSQTYRPGHHNFTEEFIFEPRLDENVPAELIAELNGKNIALLHVDLEFFDQTARVMVLGLDGRLRELGANFRTAGKWGTGK
jgi:hypothetical protein